MVVALMQAQSTRPVKTFTIGFNDSGYDEAGHAKAVAHHLGTEHTELYVTPEEARDVIPKLPVLFDEPFADSSQIPTSLISQLTRKHVTVSLSGDGGDELFGGYNRYIWTRTIWNTIKWFPSPMRNLVSRILGSFSEKSWDALYGLADFAVPKSHKISQAGIKMHKLAEVIMAPNPDLIYRSLISHWKSPCEVVSQSQEPNTILTGEIGGVCIKDIEQRMMLLDGLTYLPDDILVKMDRTAMGESLETRVPLLDHRVVEFAWRLPLKMKIRDGTGKWLLRKLLAKHVPQELFERPKMGFAIPLDGWLRGPLRDWAEDLLSEKRLNEEGIFDTRIIRSTWAGHLEGKPGVAYQLWDILVYQSWSQANCGPTSNSSSP
jgi:asparagine synthase (glutamine-hydrolysing)